MLGADYDGGGRAWIWRGDFYSGLSGEREAGVFMVVGYWEEGEALPLGGWTFKGGGLT